MPLPHSDVLDRLTDCSRDLTSADPVLLSDDLAANASTNVIGAKQKKPVPIQVGRPRRARPIMAAEPSRLAETRRARMLFHQTSPASRALMTD
jgi:hypothetical protein